MKQVEKLICLSSIFEILPEFALELGFFCYPTLAKLCGSKCSYLIFCVARLIHALQGQCDVLEQKPRKSKFQALFTTIPSVKMENKTKLCLQLRLPNGSSITIVL